MRRHEHDGPAGQQRSKPRNPRQKTWQVEWGPQRKLQRTLIVAVMSAHEHIQHMTTALTMHVATRSVKCSGRVRRMTPPPPPPPLDGELSSFREPPSDHPPPAAAALALLVLVRLSL